MHTPGPWTIRRGGGHKAPSIIGSESIHTNGRERNAAGYSSAAYSDEVCEFHNDLDLPGPAANARLIAAAPTLLKICKRFREAMAADKYAAYTAEEKESGDPAYTMLCIALEECEAAIALAEAK